MKVQCIAAGESFSVGKIYEFSDEYVIDDQGNKHHNFGDNLKEWNDKQWDNAYIRIAKFAEVKEPDKQPAACTFPGCGCVHENNYTPAVDKLQFMFDRQTILQKELMGVCLPADKPELVSYHALGLYTELGEVLQADKRWKPWKNGDKAHNKRELTKEIADCWLFLINLTLVHNIDSEELFYAFMLKHNEVCQKNNIEGIEI